MEPEWGGMDVVEQTFGWSRATQYRLLTADKIKAVKVGRKILIDLRSVRTYLASLPPAKLKFAKAA